ncbi:hypothetical protein KXD40_009588 [Peronospora effusa]|uniref:Uncharacterized protein n=1 Tax=Peronospora effusa TaxID=542832 RepID=A0A3M6VGK2_9STRA|nr:hypothetical protein DD238_003832 [Peronospora effusa]UIZ23679.1 hypothetical protein KXD40_009588 [Peronospora effusa]
MSAPTNVFSALQPEKRKKKTLEGPKNTMFASFVNNPSTSAWGDDSDDEIHVTAVSKEKDEEDEELEEEEDDDDDDDESDSEEEEEEEENEKPLLLTKPITPARTLSKKEKKELEMKEFEAALADLGIKAEDAPKKETEEIIVAMETSATSDKKKKKKKGKKPLKVSEKETEISDVVDIKAVMKTKTKKKKTSEPVAVRIAREEKAKSKNKSKKDKSSFNEFSI